MSVRFSCIVPLLLAAPALVAGQGEERVHVTGEVAIEGTTLRSDLTAELSEPHQPANPGTAQVSTLGSFDFGAVPPGRYRLLIRDNHGRVLTEQYLEVRRLMGPVQLRLPGEARNRPVAGTISAARLGHRPPGKAENAFKKAQRAFRKDQFEPALQHLREALLADPDYFEALCLSGSAYLRTGRPGLAVEAFERAAALDPASAPLQTELAAALASSGRDADAEAAIRRAIALQPGEPRSNYFLALILRQQNRTGPEMLRALELAGSRFPNAHLLAAEVLSRQGSPARAAVHLERYLASGEERHRASVEQALSRLRSGLRASQ